jgi:hypothetical protein
MPRDPVDPIQGYDEQNRPIFGFNEGHEPVCYSRLPGRKHLRCMSPVRCANGRCKKHGGKVPKGPQHHSFRTGEWSKWMPKTSAQDLLNAVQDPEYLSLRDDMAMNAVEVLNLTKQFEQGTDQKTWAQIDKIATELEILLFSEGVTAFLTAMGGEGSDLTKMGGLMEQLVRLIKQGRDEQRIFREIGEATERRRKLVETETKRMMMEKNNMPADQVLHLFSSFVNVVKKIWAHDAHNLRAFAAELDSLSGLMPTNNVALQGTPGVSGMVAPKSALGERVRNQSDSIVVEVEEED